jgi:hypothetical protein
MFNELIHFLGDKLSANTTADFADVYTYEIEEFVGDPIAVITPSSNESDYFTNKENTRVYAFKIMIFVNRIKRTKDEAEQVLRSIVSAIIDDFDRDYMLTGLDCPVGYTFVNVFATPSSWGYLGAESEYRIAEINLKCKMIVDVNLI